MSDARTYYVTIVAAPEGWERPALLGHTVAATGLNAADVRLRLAGGLPALVGPLDRAAVVSSKTKLRRAGVDCFAFGIEDLAALGGTIKLRAATFADGGLSCPAHDGGLPYAFRFDEIRILVRGQVRRIDRDRREKPRPPIGMMTTQGYVAPREDLWTPMSHRIVTSEHLDIHTSAGHILQIDGKRFDYELLGDFREPAPKANLDRLTDMIAHFAPNAIRDDYYKLWRSPPAASRLHLPPVSIGDENIDFAFYSRWCSLLYAHVAGV